MEQVKTLSMRLSADLEKKLSETVERTGFPKSVILRSLLVQGLDTLTDDDLTELIIQLARYRAVKDHLHESSDSA